MVNPYNYYDILLYNTNFLCPITYKLVFAYNNIM